MARTTIRLVAVVCLLVTALVLAESSSAATSVARTAPAPGTSAVLSNERTSTLSARVLYNGVIRRKPSMTAKAMGRLHQLTEDGYPEVYLALRSYTDADGREWTQIRVPGRPNGRTGWVVRDNLAAFNETRWRVVVNRKTLRMSVFWNGKLRRRLPVGVGKHTTPTPGGRFWIREKIRVTDHSSPYWPYALGTADYSTLSEWPGGGVVGIHGDWNQPQLIPGRPSHGCIRMRDADVGWVAKHVPVGTPLRIL